MRWVVPGQGGQGVRQQESPLSHHDSGVSLRPAELSRTRRVSALVDHQWGLPARIGKVCANEFSSADHRLPSFLRGLELFLSQRGDATEIASGLRGPISYYFLGII